MTNSVLNALENACTSLILQAGIYRQLAKTENEKANIGLAEEMERNVDIYRKIAEDAKAEEKRKQENRGLGFTNLPIRFFAFDEEIKNEYDDTEGDIVEVSEQDFIEAEGEITYERHSVFANGVKQICLTKSPF